jgi:GT2 family glycosyltransferase
MNDKTVAVVIVNYNGGRMLTECVRSVLASDTHVTVYVSDNGSTDGSIAHLRAELPDEPLLNIIEHGRNLGFAAGNNAAFALVRTKYVLCLNPDAILGQRALETLVRYAEERSEFACFAARLVQSEHRHVLDGAGDAYHVSGLVWRRGHGAQSNAARYGEPAEVFSACGAAALYRKEAIEAAGGFDEDYFCYLEDVDLGFRLRLLGYRTLYVPEATVYHVGSATTGRESDFVVYHGHRNLVWTYVKNMPPTLFWIYLPLHLVANLAMVLRYGLKGRWRIILAAKRDAVKGIPMMWRKRRRVQAARVSPAWQLRKAMHTGWPSRRERALGNAHSASTG